MKVIRGDSKTFTFQRKAPILPPIIASRSRVDSGIRHFPFLAFSLSIP